MIEIITIGGNGAGQLTTTVKRDIKIYLWDATADDNEIVTAQRLSYFIRLSLIRLLSKIGSFVEVSYEAHAVIKTVKVEIREYFVEEDGISIDGAVATICEMLGMCPGESSPPLPEPACSEDFILYEDSCIYVSHTTTARNWVEANISCSELHSRANLATIHTPAELAFIRSRILLLEQYWVVNCKFRQLFLYWDFFPGCDGCLEMEEWAGLELRQLETWTASWHGERELHGDGCRGWLLE